MEGLLTCVQVGRILDVSDRVILRYIKHGLLTIAHKKGRKYFIAQDELMRFREQHAVLPYIPTPRTNYVPKLHPQETPEYKAERLLRAQKYAHEKEGACLSEVYTHSHAPMRWRCKNGHEWLAPYEKITKGRWCRHCRKLKVDYIKPGTQPKNEFRICP